MNVYESISVFFAYVTLQFTSFVHFALRDVCVFCAIEDEHLFENGNWCSSDVCHGMRQLHFLPQHASNVYFIRKTFTTREFRTRCTSFARSLPHSPHPQLVCNGVNSQKNIFNHLIFIHTQHCLLFYLCHLHTSVSWSRKTGRRSLGTQASNNSYKDCARCHKRKLEFHSAEPTRWESCVCARVHVCVMLFVRYILANGAHIISAECRCLVWKIARFIFIKGHPSLKMDCNATLLLWNWIEITRTLRHIFHIDWLTMHARGMYCLYTSPKIYNTELLCKRCDFPKHCLFLTSSFLFGRSFFFFMESANFWVFCHNSVEIIGFSYAQTVKM